MKQTLFIFSGFLFLANMLFAGDSTTFDTQWIPAKPEMLTYTSTGKQGNGLYQIAVSRGDAGIEIYMNIITTGFTKTVSGTMGFDMRPLQSKSKIIVDGQIIMNTDCSYEQDKLHISTVMKPYNRIVKNDISFSGMVIDFSQLPLVARTLRLQVGAEYRFQSLSPQTNTIMPFIVKIIGEETIRSIQCYKIESDDFEGRSVYWIEKGERRRIVRIEQPAANRVTELLL